MKKISYIIVSLLLLAALFWVYRGYDGKKEDNYAFIASDALFVLETQDPIRLWNRWSGMPYFETLEELPAIRSAGKQLLALDSLLGGSGEVDALLKGQRFTVSLHSVGKERFDFLYLLALADGKAERIIQQLERILPEGVRLQARTYSSVPLYEVTQTGSDFSLTLAAVDNVLLVSYTSFLIEQAIRVHRGQAVANFRASYSELFSGRDPSDPLAMLRVTADGLYIVNRSIVDSAEENMLDLLKNRQVGGSFQVLLREQGVELEGSLRVIGGRAFGASGSGELASRSAQYLSNRSSYVFQYDLDNPVQLLGFGDPRFERVVTLDAEIEQQLKSKGFFQQLTGSALFMVLEQSLGEARDRVLLLQTGEAEEQLQRLLAFVQSQSPGQQDQFTDRYRERLIVYIEEDEFPAHLLDGNFQGFKDSYVTHVDDFLVFTNSSKAMRLYLDDLALEQVWENSAKGQEQWARLGQSPGLSFYFDGPSFWNGLGQRSLPSWRPFLQQQGGRLSAFSSLQGQYAEIAGKPFARISFPIGMAAAQAMSDQQAAILQRGLSFSTPLTQGPYRLQNFTDRSVDYLVQDAENVLHLIHEEQVVFSYQIEGQLVTPVYQIDYYQNGKLQMLFATAEAVHVLDRLGNPVDAFPLTLPGQGKITHLSLVDYDRNKNYRYFLGTSSGELFLMDKKGQLLEGWDPLRLSGPLATAPQHHRVPGLGDRMVALTRDGNVYIFNRRGEPQVGSPVTLNAVVGTDYGMVLRGQATDSRLTTVSEGGEIVQVNFKGEVAYRNQLAKPDAEARFSLLPDHLGDRFLFIVQSFGKITVLDQEQEQLFDITSYSEDVAFRFYNFGKEASILAVLDKTQEFVYIYNLRGEMMHTLPLAGSTGFSVAFNSSRRLFEIVVVDGDTFYNYELPF